MNIRHPACPGFPGSNIRVVVANKYQKKSPCPGIHLSGNRLDAVRVTRVRSAVPGSVYSINIGLLPAQLVEVAVNVGVVSRETHTDACAPFGLLEVGRAHHLTLLPVHKPVAGRESLAAPDEVDLITKYVSSW